MVEAYHLHSRHDCCRGVSEGYRFLQEEALLHQSLWWLDPMS